MSLVRVGRYSLKLSPETLQMSSCVNVACLCLCAESGNAD